jgi:hypothetical protein
MHRDWQAVPGAEGQTQWQRHTLVAAAAGTPIGVGTLVESTLHPRMPIITVTVTSANLALTCPTRCYRESERSWRGLAGSPHPVSSVY